MTLVEFLLAEIAQDEAVARAASGITQVGERGNWQAAPGGDEWEAIASDDYDELLVAMRTDLPRPPGVLCGYWGAIVSLEADDNPQPWAGRPTEQFTHAARWDPARVLAECEAKRQIVQMFADQLEGFNAPYPTPEDIDEDKLWPEFGGGVIVGLRDALRLLALPYADRPDFREEWRA